MARSLILKSLIVVGVLSLVAVMLAVGSYQLGFQRGANSAPAREVIADESIYTVTYSIGDLLADSNSTDDRVKIFDTVIDRIVATASPASWLENGGKTGEIQPFPTNDSIVVSQSALVHSQVANVLDGMRKERGRN
jgi:hypothetical protein